MSTNLQAAGSGSIVGWLVFVGLVIVAFFIYDKYVKKTAA